MSLVGELAVRGSHYGRTVAEADELMSICAALSDRIRESAEVKGALAQAVADGIRSY